MTGGLPNVMTATAPSACSRHDSCSDTPLRTYRRRLATCPQHDHALGFFQVAQNQVPQSEIETGMDLEFSAAEKTFRSDVRAFIRENLPAALARKCSGYKRLTRDDLLSWHRILHAQRLVRAHLAGEVRRARLDRHRAAHLRRGMQCCRRAAGHRVRRAHGGAGAHGLTATRRSSTSSCRASFRASTGGVRAIAEPGSGSDLASLKTRRCAKAMCT